MAKREPEQFTLDREDKLRIDLQGKIEKIDMKIETKTSQLDQKVEQKVSNHVFYSLITILLTILVGIIGYAFFLINQLDNTVSQTNVLLAHLETKIDMNKPRR